MAELNLVRRSVRIMNRAPFSGFTNTRSNPIVIDQETSDEDLPKNELQDNDRPVIVGGAGNHPNIDKKEHILLDEYVSAEIAGRDAGVETKMKELSMKEKDTSDKELKGKRDLGEDFKKQPVIFIGSSSRSARSSVEAEKHIQENKVGTVQPTDKDTCIASSCNETSGIEGKIVGQLSMERRVEKEMKNENDKKRKTTRKDLDVSNSKKPRFDTIRTRTSPRTLYETIIGLTPDQKNAVESLGLGSLLDMKVDGVPTKLGFFVVDSLNTAKMRLELPSGNIPITIQSIHGLLDLPTGGMDLLELDDNPSGIELVKQWKGQFNRDKMRPSDVMSVILQSDNSGFMFKMNFLVLFVNLMVDCNSMGCCKLNFLSKIKGEEMVANIDWCKYIYDKLKTSKLRWRSDNTMCFYAGPLTYLILLYVESTISPRVVGTNTNLALSAWNMGLLRKRETIEIENGGFGLLPIKEGFKIEKKKATETSKVPITPTKELGVKEYIEFMEVRMKLLMRAKNEAERVLDIAVEKFPREVAFIKYMNELESLFKTNRWCEKKVKVEGGVSKKLTKSTMVETIHSDDSCWESPHFVAAVSETMDREVRKSVIKKALAAITAPDFGITQPNFDLGISPDKTTGNCSSADNTTTKSLRPKDELTAPEFGITQPNFDLGISPDKSTGNCSSADNTTTKSLRPKDELTGRDDELNLSNKGKNKVGAYSIPLEKHEHAGHMNEAPNPTSRITVRETRRIIKLGDHLRSPYLQRTVDLHVTSEDKRMHDWMMSAYGGKFDYVFWSHDDAKIYRYELEKLAANTSVDHKVIDAYDEKYRNRDSPRRHFFTTTVMGDIQRRNRSIDMNKEYGFFRRNLSAAAKHNKDVVRMKDIDLVFFPMIKSAHFYLVAFNLKNPAVVILDNMFAAHKDDEAMMKSYGYATDILQMLMIKHLTLHGHPHVQTLGDIVQERLQMEWQTCSNYQDSGVFAMRHMETYMGDNKAWNTGFESTESKQGSQLLDLRMKYITKLLLSNCNKKKGFVQAEIGKFMSIDPNIRAELIEKARVTRSERLL